MAETVLILEVFYFSNDESFPKRFNSNSNEWMLSNFWLNVLFLYWMLLIEIEKISLSVVGSLSGLCRVDFSTIQTQALDLLRRKIL